MVDEVIGREAVRRQPAAPVCTVELDGQTLGNIGVRGRRDFKVRITRNTLDIDPWWQH